MKSYVVAWVCGFVVAIVLGERWRRMGGASVSTTPSEGEPTEVVAPVVTTTRARTVASTASKSIVAGIKADLARLRQLQERRRPGHHEDLPAATADDPASPVADEQ